MRKIFSLGLFALAVFTMPAHLFAGTFEYCETHKITLQEEGTYGICNAWHNADTDVEKAKFEDKYFEKTGEDPPWVNSAVCPCFTNLDLAAAIALEDADRFECGAATESNGLFYYFDVHDDDVLVSTRIASFEAGNFGGFGLYCDNTVKPHFQLFISTSETAACISTLEAAADVLLDLKAIDCATP